MKRILAPTLCLALATACTLPEDELSWEEAGLALDETVESGRGEAFVAEPIELGTSFTIGAALEEAAEELRAWLESQLPCAELSLEGHTVIMDLGGLDDLCTYRGSSYGGMIKLTVEATEADELRVRHEWVGLTDGALSLDGEADVNWTQADTLTRHVVHQMAWVDEEGRSIDATGDREQWLLDPELGIEGGLGIRGVRDWVSETGSWHLDIEDVLLELDDPVPYDGTYIVTNPDGKQLVMHFERLDEDTIEVSIEGGRLPIVFEVNSFGGID